MTKATEKLIEDYKVEYLRVNGRTPIITVQSGWITIDQTHKYRKIEIVAALTVLRGRKDFYATPQQNMLGEDVTPQTLTFKFETPHLTIFRGGEFVGMVSPNGWTGKSKVINYPLGEPLLYNLVGDNLSLTEMEQIIAEWKKSIIDIVASWKK